MKALDSPTVLVSDLLLWQIATRAEQNEASSLGLPRLQSEVSRAGTALWRLQPRHCLVASAVSRGRLLWLVAYFQLDTARFPHLWNLVLVSGSPG